jgi:hypothetical protein
VQGRHHERDGDRRGGGEAGGDDHAGGAGCRARGSCCTPTSASGVRVS